MMVVLPVPTPVAMPLASTVATVVLLDVQAADPETLPVELSEKLPEAVKVVVVPLAIDVVSGATEMPVSVAAVTDTLTAGAVTTPYVPALEAALIVVVPTALPNTTPELLYACRSRGS